MVDWFGLVGLGWVVGGWWGAWNADIRVLGLEQLTEPGLIEHSCSLGHQQASGCSQQGLREAPSGACWKCPVYHFSFELVSVSCLCQATPEAV